MVDSLKQAGVEIRKILYECEREGDNFDVTLNKVSDVKVLGESFSTLMLMKIIDKFAEEYETRTKAQGYALVNHLVAKATASSNIKRATGLIEQSDIQRKAIDHMNLKRTIAFFQGQ